jgi:hypothetical protein
MEQGLRLRVNLKNKSGTSEASMKRRAQRGSGAANPKLDPGTSNQIKDPDEWVSGREPMTGAQASYLKTLSEEAHEPDLYDPDLDKAEASKRIDRLRGETGRD